MRTSAGTSRGSSTTHARRTATSRSSTKRSGSAPRATSVAAKSSLTITSRSGRPRFRAGAVPAVPTSCNSSGGSTISTSLTGATGGRRAGLVIGAADGASASQVPSVRAARVDPLRALRSEQRLHRDALRERDDVAEHPELSVRPATFTPAADARPGAIIERRGLRRELLPSAAAAHVEIPDVPTLDQLERLFDVILEIEASAPLLSKRFEPRGKHEVGHEDAVDLVPERIVLAGVARLVRV